MDDTDQRLLAAISEDARRPLKRAAEEAGVSRETADYRLNKLEKRGVIQGYKARLNLSRFVQSTHIVFLRLKRWKGREEPHVLDFFREAKYPHWIGRASGKWDVLFFFSTTERDELDEFLNEIYDYFGDNLKEHVLLTLNKEAKNTQKTLFGTAEPKTSFAGGEEQSLDEKDLTILKMLCEDAKHTNKEIAEQVNLTDEAVRYRVNKLEESDYILNYRTIIDLKRAGYTQYAVSMTFSGTTSNDKEEIQTALANHSKTTYAAETLGGYTVFTLIAAKTLEEFNEEIRELKNEFAPHLEDLQVTPITQSEHLSFF